jgi:hexosaminidase
MGGMEETGQILAAKLAGEFPGVPMSKAGNAASHVVIPAPLRFDVAKERKFVLRPGTALSYVDDGVASAVRRFCRDIARRTRVSLVPTVGPATAGSSIEIQVANDDKVGALPGPTGVWPVGAGPADERYSLTIDEDRIVVRAAEQTGVVRALTTLAQLLAFAPGGEAQGISLPCAWILDAPRYAWRGLSLDLSRAFFTVGEVRRVIDLLALYKLNVLHLHLTDDQSWRLPMGRLGAGSESGDAFYSVEDLRALVSYAEDRCVTVVPEVDMPGHTAALIRLNPRLGTCRNMTEPGLLRGREDRTGWLDPELPATFELIEEVLTAVAEIFHGSFIHIGGDEPYGMPRDLYMAYVERVRRIVRSLGKRPMGWQESARAGLGPDDVIQYWLTDLALAESLSPEIRAQLVADLALSRRDVETAVAASVPMIVSPVSHCYLDVPYAEPSAEAVQADKQERVGLRRYSPMTVSESFQWEPSQTVGRGREAQVAGVEAAIWAETLSGFDDLSFMLLPRLPGIAQKAWSAPAAADWPHHRDGLARHARLWAQDDLAYFRTSTVDWL